MGELPKVCGQCGLVHEVRREPYGCIQALREIISALTLRIEHELNEVRNELSNQILGLAALTLRVEALEEREVARPVYWSDLPCRECGKPAGYFMHEPASRCGQFLGCKDADHRQSDHHVAKLDANKFV